MDIFYKFIIIYKKFVLDYIISESFVQSTLSRLNININIDVLHEISNVLEN